MMIMLPDPFSGRWVQLTPQRPLDEHKLAESDKVDEAETARRDKSAHEDIVWDDVLGQVHQSALFPDRNTMPRVAWLLNRLAARHGQPALPVGPRIDGWSFD